MYTRKKSIFCMIIAFFLFFSGMCLENVQADSSLAYIVNNTPIAHTISQETEIVKSEVYTTENLNIRNISYTSQLGNRNMSNRKVMKKSMECWHMRKELQSISNFYTTADVIQLPELCGKTVMLRYIHNQDGKKKA